MFRFDAQHVSLKSTSTGANRSFEYFMHMADSLLAYRNTALVIARDALLDRNVHEDYAKPEFV